jgi:hypothetical protein
MMPGSGSGLSKLEAEPKLRDVTHSWPPKWKPRYSPDEEPSPGPKRGPDRLAC